MPTIKYQELTVGEANDLSDLFRIGRALQFGASNANLWFRGQANAEWKLKPKVHRGYDSKAEGEMLGTFMSQSHSRSANCPASTDNVGWLCWAQHYGIPTRLLDWSKSLLTAAYFAVTIDDHPNDHADKPGAIWVTSQGILNWHLTGSSLCLPFTEEMLKSTSKAIAVVAPRPEMRMFVQQGVFTLHNDRSALDDISEAKPALHKIIISGRRAKRHILTEMACLCGIHRATIYPEMEHLAAQIRASIVPDMLTNAGKDFDVRAINVSKTPVIPADSRFFWGGPPSEQSFTSELDARSYCTTNTAAWQTAAPASMSISTGVPKVADRVRILAGEFNGFSGTVENVDSASNIATVLIRLFGLESRAQFRMQQLKILDAKT